VDDPKVYFYQLAVDVCGSLINEDQYLDSVVSAEDIEDFRGVCQIRLYNYPQPVLVVYAMGEEECSEEDFKEKAPLAELTQIRAALPELNLEELGCYVACGGDGDEEDEDSLDDDDAHVCSRGYHYALVVQVVPSYWQHAEDNMLSTAARELAKLVWDVT